MKKVLVVLSLMMFVGSLTSTAFAASNGVSKEIKKDDKKKKKRKKDLVVLEVLRNHLVVQKRKKLVILKRKNNFFLLIFQRKELSSDGSFFIAMLDNRIDQYIDKSQDFAKPILNQLRAWIHDFCPQIEETIKWGFPNFMYKGKILCSMASFKKHCAFGFWLSPLMKTEGLKEGATGALGKIQSLDDLPDLEIFKMMIFEAVELTDAGKKLPKASTSKSELIESPDFLKSLNLNATALTRYQEFSPSHKKEYNQWILEAKTETTRNSRIEQAIDWISEGKSRNWKYEKC